MLSLSRSGLSCPVSTTDNKESAAYLHSKHIQTNTLLLDATNICQIAAHSTTMPDYYTYLRQPNINSYQGHK